MFKQWNRLTATVTLGAMLATTVFVGTKPAQANSSTWKKIAIGAAAVAGYGAIKGKNKLAIGGAAVAAGAYLKSRSDRKNELSRYRNSQYRNSHYRGSSYDNGGYRNAAYSGNGYSNGQHRGWTQGKHKGWSKSKHSHKKCH